MIRDDPQADTRFSVRALETAALAGFLVYAMAAPHSIAGSWIGISIVVLVWVIRTLVTRKTGLRRTALDLPLWLFFGWTVLSSLFSIEPRQSIPKLINVATFLMFYLAQAMLTRRTAVMVAIMLIASASAGVLWGAGELILGRGVIVAQLSNNSSLRLDTPLQAGDVVWRVNGHRVSSAAEIDALIRATPPGQRAGLSVISHGEHVEWPGVLVTDEMRHAASPSGIVGGGRSHNFRASGWTRHYETFAEVLQLIGLLACAFAVARWRSVSAGPRSSSMPLVLAAVAFVILAVGIALTAMRTTLLAFAFGMFVMAWRVAASKRQRVAFAALGLLILALGIGVVWRTRARGALSLQDPSASSRLQVAQVAARRVILHPFLGHGMDAMHEHWNEWGFPGKDMLDAHSTPIQIAFDRGLPALGLWLWLMYVFWRMATRTEKKMRGASTAIHGLVLGITGGFAGFLLSSMVNYNFGDSEVALLLWWMMGAVVVIDQSSPPSTNLQAITHDQR